MRQNQIPYHTSIDTTLYDNTCWEEISLLDKRFVIQRVKNVDKLLDAISEEEFKKDERLPYWADIWPSAIALSEYVLENQKVFKGKKILELGCGLGLVGITVTAIGGDVLFTDYDPHALRFTQTNFKRNFSRPASVQLLDWRNPSHSESFDIILAADILYEKRWLGPVLNILDKKLTMHGIAYIADPDRTVAREIYSMIESKNWHRQSVLKRTQVYDKLHAVIINRITKC
ncbi:MAG: methyltransferase domain-containing protein [Calditrichia bacterium]|nr:methyltransferase domain-containing protein [Calditrichia bacterium]